MKAEFIKEMKKKKIIPNSGLYKEKRNNFFSVKIYISLVDMIPADRTTNEYPVSVKLYSYRCICIHFL